MTESMSESQEAGEAEGEERQPVDARTKSLLMSGLVLVLLVALAAILPVPYVILRPGPTFNTLGEDAGKPVINVSGARTYPTQGGLNLTTVSEAGGPFGKVSLVEAFLGWLDSSTAVLPERILFPTKVDSAEVEEQNSADFVDSQTQATTAALRYLNKPVVSVVLVNAVAPKGASAGSLKPGDVMAAIDGTTLGSAQQAADLISSKKPETVVVFSLVRNGKPVTAKVTTRKSTKDPKTSVVGIVVADGFQGKDITVKYGLESVGGPSAGLMFSLGVVDKLTVGSLTAGKTIAGTGTIDDKGLVGPIGGVQQKVVGAQRDGATFFLTPTRNCLDAFRAAPKGLTLIRVETLSDAVAQLENVRKGKPTTPC